LIVYLYERCRTHLSLEKDAPVSRPVELPSLGQVIEIPKVGGLCIPKTPFRGFQQNVTF